MFYKSILDINYSNYRDRIVSIMVFICILLTVFIDCISGFDIVYTHFYYIPIILAVIWYQRKGIYIAVVLSLVHIMANYGSTGFQPIPVIRGIVFIIIALFVLIVYNKYTLTLAGSIQAVNSTNQRNLVGEMAITISHEIRNPLTTTRGFIQLLENEADDYQKEYFSLILNEIDQANSTISQFLTLSNKKTSYLEPCDLNTVVLDLLPLINEKAEEYHITTQIDLQRLPDVALDRIEIGQVVWNLTLNGIDAMPNGGILTIKTLADNHSVFLLVKDLGAGINPTIIPKLGIPFVTNKPGGAGLGLAKCYSIAARHDARIKFTTSSEGTIFTLEIPMAKQGEYN